MCRPPSWRPLHGIPASISGIPLPFPPVLSAGDPKGSAVRKGRGTSAMAAAQTALAEITEPGIRVIPLLELTKICAIPEVANSLRRAQHPAVLSAQQLL